MLDEPKMVWPSYSEPYSQTESEWLKLKVSGRLAPTSPQDDHDFRRRYAAILLRERGGK